MHRADCPTLTIEREFRALKVNEAHQPRPHVAAEKTYDTRRNRSPIGNCGIYWMGFTLYCSRCGEFGTSSSAGSAAVPQTEIDRYPKDAAKLAAVGKINMSTSNATSLESPNAPYGSSEERVPLGAMEILGEVTEDNSVLEGKPNRRNLKKRVDAKSDYRIPKKSLDFTSYDIRWGKSMRFLLTMTHVYNRDQLLWCEIKGAPKSSRANGDVFPKRGASPALGFIYLTFRVISYGLLCACACAGHVNFPTYQ